MQPEAQTQNGKCIGLPWQFHRLTDSDHYPELPSRRIESKAGQGQYFAPGGRLEGVMPDAIYGARMECTCVRFQVKEIRALFGRQSGMIKPYLHSEE